MEAGLEIRYCKLEEILPWAENPKVHDDATIRESIARYGFRDAIIYDETLGAIVAGNGRLGILREMRDSGAPVPAGILVDEESGDWVVPVQHGIRARNIPEAVAFAIDHNNLVASASSLSSGDLVALWNRRGLAKALELAGGSITLRVSSIQDEISVPPSAGVDSLPSEPEEKFGSGGGAFSAAKYGTFIKTEGYFFPINEEELQKLEAALEDWYSVHGGYLGFCGYLLGMSPEEPSAEE